VRRLGLHWELNPHDLVDRDLFWHGGWEPQETNLIAALVKPGHTILDVGANFGYFSLTTVKLLRGACAIHAFEPNPPTYARLVRHLSLNRITSVTPHNLGLGNQPAKLYLCVDPENSGASYLTTTPPSAGAPAAVVEVVTLDAFVRQQALSKIDFVKVDVEGFECFFLDGAAETLKRFAPAIMIECHPGTLARNQQTPASLYERLRNLGYRYFWICAAGEIVKFTPGIFEPSHPHYDAAADYYNVFCFQSLPADVRGPAQT